MGSRLLVSLLAFIYGLPSVPAQELKETDALCNEDGCYAVYFQRKTFLESWRACKEKGGNLATFKHQEAADAVDALFSGVDLRHSRTRVRVWIGLQRQPRQCLPSHPLRGFSWTTGDQDTQYTAWQREDSPTTCSTPRCVVIGYSTAEQQDNLKWLDGSCTVPVDGYLCHYTYRGMCSPLWSEGGGNALYTTPFKLLSTLLTHVPFGSVATLPCPAGTKNDQTVLCMLKDGDAVGWSEDAPLCSDPVTPRKWCEAGNSGCEHFCREAGGNYYCECSDGFHLGEDGKSCELADVCQSAPCEYECLPLSDGYRCACPEGYMLAPDERGCVDVDECLQSPCEQLCVNAPGTFECRCRDGYRPNEEGECEDVDECMNDPCEHACENTQGSHVCHCHLGFSATPEDSSRCQDTDECQIPGMCEQMCVNYEGGFECYCEVGYKLRSDHLSCQRITAGVGDDDEQAAVTPPFHWVTHNVPVWTKEDPDYEWTDSQTDWPPEDEETLTWLSDPPTVLGSDVIWVTRAPHEVLPFAADVDTATLEPGREEVTEEQKEGEQFPSWLLWTETEQADSTSAPPSATSTPPTATSIAEWYIDQEEETTIGLELHPTSSISEGAWTWAWFSPTPADRVEPGVDETVSTESTPHPSSVFPVEGAEGSEEIQHLVTPKHPRRTTAAPAQGGAERGDGVDSVQGSGEHKQGSSWLLVGLLVPFCIFLVVMVALGIVYCTRCAVQPRNKNATDCYHWISGAHDKQGAPNPSAGVKSHV